MKRLGKLVRRHEVTRDVRTHFYIAISALLFVFITVSAAVFHLDAMDDGATGLKVSDPAAATIAPRNDAVTDSAEPTSAGNGGMQDWQVLWLGFAILVTSCAIAAGAIRSALDRLEKKINQERTELEERFERQGRKFKAELKARDSKLEAVRESEQRFRAVVEGLTHGIIVHRDGSPLYANPGIAEMLAYDHPNEVLALHSISDFVFEDDVVLVRNLWTRRMHGEKLPDVVGYRCQRKDNEIISVEVRATTIEWDGEPAVLAACYDTTEQKSGEYAVRQNEVRLRRLLETIPYGVQENDIEGTITFSNAANAAIFGCEVDEHVGKKIWDFVADRSRREELKAYFEKIVAQQPPPEPYLGKSLTKDGREIYVRTDWSYIRSQTGHLLGFTSILTDITESKRSQQALERSEAHFRTLAEESSQGITVTKGDRLVFANPAAVDMLGYDSLEAFLNIESVDELVHPDDIEFIRNRRMARLRNEDVPEEYELRLIAIDGGTVWVENRVTTIEWDGEAAVFSIYSDITEKKMAASERELADQSV